MLFYTSELAITTNRDDELDVRNRVCKDLQPLAADIKVIPVKDMRDTKQVRTRVCNGGITLIAPRGEITDDASETTVVISLETLQQLIAKTIGRTLEIQEMREHPADILTGLPPIVATDEDRDVDFTAASKLPSAEVSSFLKL